MLDATPSEAAIPTLEFDRLRISYAARTVLNIAQVQLNPGECLAVVGHNGVGKSTLLRAILGLVPIESGQIKLFGKAVKRGSRLIGYLPQARQAAENHKLSSRAWLSALYQAQSMGLFPFYSKQLKEEQEVRFNEIVALVRAESFIDRPFLSLSGGERQRLLLAQALLLNPKVLLLDEPLSCLDLDYQYYLGELIQSLCKDQGLTVVLTAHATRPLRQCIHHMLRLNFDRPAKLD